MKNIISNIKRVLLTAVLVAFAAGASAQALRTGYFLDGSFYSYRLNPAIQPSRGHFALPILGGIDLNTAGNVGLGNFLYDNPSNPNELVTFMHPSVDAKDFLSKLDEKNIIQINTDITLFSLAFTGFGGFNSIDLSLHSDQSMNIPYGMFAFMKEMSNKKYSFSDLTMQSRNYLDLSIGHSHEVISGLTVGARVKFLFGMGYANVNFDKMDINLGKNNWQIAAKGQADIALGGAYTYSDELTNSGKTVIDGYEDATAGLQGFGLGADLGVTYDFHHLPVLKGLKVSASLTDLGYISWSKTARAEIAPEDTYNFDGFTQMGLHGNAGNTLDDQWSDMRDDLEDFFALEDKGETSVKSGIGAKLNLGAEYEMPFYNKLSAGILFTHCFDDVFSYNKTSVMVNLSPSRVFDIAVSGTKSDYGTNLGAMINLHCTGMSLFVGTDCIISKVNKQFIPLEDMNASIMFGINIGFKHKDKK